MSHDKAKTLYRPLIAAALRSAESLPPLDRADIFEGVAHLTRRFDPQMSAQAQSLADALRDAEALQLHFRNLCA